MKYTQITRRFAMACLGAGLLSVMGGCAAVATIGRVVVNLPWSNIVKITSAVLSTANATIAIAAQLPDTIKRLTAELTSENTTTLADGGPLVLRSKSGQEFEVPYTIQ